jgi:Arc/MetJ-type ribon-helix-helix transcriptional regulator
MARMEDGGVAVGARGKYMEDMALRTTVVLTDEDEQALREASRREGVSQSELIRRGVRMVTAAYRRRGGPSVGWLSLSGAERKALQADEFGDFDG